MVAAKLVKGQILSDTKNWILKFDGCKNPMYYSNLESCLESYLQHRLRSSDAPSVQKLLDFHKLAIKQLNSSLEPLKIRITGGKNEN